MLVKSKLTGQQYMFPDDMDQGQISQAIRQAEADQEVPDYSPMGRRVPLREYLQGLGESAQAFGRQATSAMLGLPGEIESLVRLREPQQVSRLLSGQPLESTLPQTDDVRPYVDKVADSLVGEQTSEVIGEGGKEAFEFMGDVLAPLGIQPTKQAIDLARKAPIGLLNMMAEAPQGLSAQRGMFVGPKSLLFNQDAADLAKNLESKDASDVEIWSETGELGAPMHKSPEGVYLQEISDAEGGFVTSDMALMSDNIGANSFELDGKFYSASPSMKLGDVLNHPSLFDHYPELRDMPIYVAEGNAPFGGMVQKGKIYINDLLVQPEYYDELYKTLLHETQHAIRGSEKALGSGGSPASASRFQMGLTGLIDDKAEDIDLVNQMPDLIRSRDRVELSKKIDELDRLKGYRRSYYSNGNNLTGKEKHIINSGRFLVGDNRERQIRAEILGGVKRKNRNDALDKYIDAIEAEAGIQDSPELEYVQSVRDEYKNATRKLERDSKEISEIYDLPETQRELNRLRAAQREIDFRYPSNSSGENEPLYRALADEVRANITGSSSGMSLMDRIAMPAQLRDDYKNAQLVISGPERYSEFLKMGDRPSRREVFPIIGEKPEPQASMSTGILDEIDTSYRGSHTAPYRDDEGYHSSLDDLTSMYGDDIYTGNALRYFGEGRDYDKKAIDIIQRMAGDPDAEVTIYRALPIGQNEINPRDWVTTTREYALDHIGDDEGYHIVSKKVKASDVFSEGNSIHEFGYDPLEQ